MQRNSIHISPISIGYPDISKKAAVFAKTSLAVPFDQSQYLHPVPEKYRKYLDANSLHWLGEEKIAPERLALARQVHGNKVHYIDAPGIYPDIDGFYTDLPEIYLTIRTADCAAILVSVPDIPVVGIAHAGWRGAKADIVGNLIDQMKQRWNVDAERFQVAVSPHIRACCYEVGAEFVDYFRAQFLQRKNGKLHLDLERVIVHQLQERGIAEKNILVSPHCTSCSSLPLYSYRAQNQTTNRLLSVIAIQS